jgi:hypothetical protein
MKDDRYAQYGAATGILFVVLLIVSFIIVTPTPPDVKASAEEWSNYYVDEQDGIRAGLLLISIALFLFVWFLGSLATALRAAAGNPRLPTVAFGGGLLGAVFIFGAVSLSAAAAYRPEETSAELTRALSDVGLVAGAPAAAGFTALFAATALVILRTDLLNEGLGWLSAAAAVTQLLPLGVIFTDEGVFAPDGALGFIVPFIAFVVTIAALSVAIMRNLPEAGGPGITDRVRGAVSGAAAGATRPPRSQ